MKPKVKTSSQFTSNDEAFLSRLSSLYEKIKDEGRIDVFGGLTFEVSDRIKGNDRRIAELKGDKIEIKRSASTLPDEALKYVIAHELAHVHAKRHTRKFQKMIEAIYPDFKEGLDLLTKHESSIA